jgi:hypothetical protein
MQCSDCRPASEGVSVGISQDGAAEADVKKPGCFCWRPPLLLPGAQHPELVLLFCCSDMFLFLRD